jgi:hypothetical protein
VAAGVAVRPVEQPIRTLGPEAKLGNSDLAPRPWVEERRSFLNKGYVIAKYSVGDAELVTDTLRDAIPAILLKPSFDLVSNLRREMHSYQPSMALAG